MNASEREARLIQQAIEGDSAALKVLLIDSYEFLSNRISRRIPADLARLVDVDDLIQEVQIEVFRRIHTFDQRSPDAFSRWLTTMALNRLRNAIKHHRAAKRGGGRIALGSPKKNVGDSSIALFDRFADPGRTPSRSVSRREAIEAVRMSLAKLPEHYRQAVWLVHIEGRAVKDAAAKMGRTERAIHGLCRRGLKQLEDQLQSASRFLSSGG